MPSLAMLAKLKLLMNETKQINMLIHPSKSQFMVVNSADREPFILEGIKISHTNEYVYLGSPISVTPIRDLFIFLLFIYYLLHEQVIKPLYTCSQMTTEPANGMPKIPFVNETPKIF